MPYRFHDLRDTDLVLKEVDFVGGSAGASSRYYSSSHGPELAFQQDATNDRILWESGRDELGNGYFVRFPHLLWYRFKTPIVPGRVSFGPAPDAKYAHEGYFGATKWQFIGTNDKICDRRSAWTILCEDLSGKYFETMMQNKYCIADTDTKYKCLGISVLESSFGYSPEVVISGIRMWERVL